MGNNFSSKYGLFRSVKVDNKKGAIRNYGILLLLRRKTGGIFEPNVRCMLNRV